MSMNDFLNTLIGKLSVQTQREAVEGRDAFLLTHKDAKVIELEEYLDKPLTTKVHRELPNVTGFVAYLKDFGKEDSRLYASPSDRTITAYIDHYTQKDTSWLSHTAALKFAVDKDWRKWLDVDGKQLTQRELVNFLLDYQNDFDGFVSADIMEFAQNIKAAKSTDIDSKVGNFDLNQVIKATVKVTSGSKEIPESFKVKVPVLEGFDKYLLEFRLSVAVGQHDSELRFKLSLVRPHLIEKAAFNDACSDVVAQGFAIYGYEQDKTSNSIKG